MYRDEQIIEVFEQFGEVIEFRRPTNLGKHLPSPFVFIRYLDEQSIWMAIEEMDCKYLWDVKIHVGEANKQNSFFTQDTGSRLRI